MRKYIGIFKNYLATSLEYRTNFFGTILNEIVSIIVVVILWISVFRTNGTIAGYTFSDTILYYFLAPLVGFISHTQIAQVIGDDVKDGSLSNKLVKPIRVWPYYFFQALAGKVSTIVTIVPLYLLILVIGTKILGTDPIQFIPLLFGFFFGLFGFLLNFVIDLSLGSLAFFLHDIWWFKHFKAFIIGILAGISFPLDFIPEAIRNVVLLLPFKFMYYTPIQYIVGKQSLGNITGDLALISFWLLIIYFGGRVLWRRGVTKYEAFGN